MPPFRKQSELPPKSAAQRQLWFAYKALKEIAFDFRCLKASQMQSVARQGIAQISILCPRCKGREDQVDQCPECDETGRVLLRADG